MNFIVIRSGFIFFQGAERWETVNRIAVFIRDVFLLHSIRSLFVEGGIEHREAGLLQLHVFGQERTDEAPRSVFILAGGRHRNRAERQKAAAVAAGNAGVADKISIVFHSLQLIVNIVKTGKGDVCQQLLLLPDAAVIAVIIVEVKVCRVKFRREGVCKRKEGLECVRFKAARARFS